MRILLVEDDLPLAKALQRSLQAEGFVVNHVNQGKLALNALSTPDQDNSTALGCGLGLTIVKHIADVHGATIELSPSTLLQGLKIKVLFNDVKEDKE